MIIKSMSRKSPSFAGLAEYALRPEGAQIDVRWNLPLGAEGIGDITAELEQNHALLPSRVNGNALYHEIIALPPLERAPTVKDRAALIDIAERYLERRAHDQLAFGVVHGNTENLHIHLIISSNRVRASSRERLSKKEFAEIQREIEAYQIENYPDLGDQHHYDEPAKNRKRTNAEQEAQRRTQTPTHNERMADELRQMFTSSNSREELAAKLHDSKLTLYKRGRSIGVETPGGRRYRLRTLGVMQEYTDVLTRIDLRESRMASFKRMRPDRDDEPERSR